MKSSISTSGSYLALVGPNTFFPTSCICKKQTVISHSSTESEIVSLEVALRTEAVPLLGLWDVIVDVFLNAYPTRIDPHGSFSSGGEKSPAKLPRSGGSKASGGESNFHTLLFSSSIC